MRQALVVGVVGLLNVFALTGCDDDKDWCEGNADEAGCAVKAPTTTASPAGGSYRPLPSVVTLTADEPAIIYYTTDGSEPYLRGPQAPSPVEIAPK